MLNNAKSRQFTGLPAADALFLGTAVLEHAGYHPLSLSQPPSAAFQKACSEDRLEPGLIHHMVVCHPFKYIYTHGDCGIIAKANKTVNNHAGPTVVPVAEKEPVNIEYLPSYWQQMIVKAPTPSYGTYHPQRLFIASINSEYDTAALDEFLFLCRNNSPTFQAFLPAGEPLEKSVEKQHQVKRLKITWEDYLDAEEFQEYYRQRLKRLFKEYRRWPLVPDFVGRKRELAVLEKAVQAYPFIQVDGGVGVGKTALLAELAAAKEKKQKIVWIHAASHFISKAEVLLSMAVQLGLLTSPDILEKENLAKFLPGLEGQIKNVLENQEVLIIFDSLNPLFKEGWQFQNEELQDLLIRWVGGGLFGQRELGKAKLVFTADLRVKDAQKDPFKKLKSSLAHAVRGKEKKKQNEQAIEVYPLEENERWPLFQEWLEPVAREPGIQKQARRLYKIGGVNLRLLRLLALWVCETKDITKIEGKIREVEETRPWDKENRVYRYLFETIGTQKQMILKTLEWIGRPVLWSVISSSAGMAGQLEELEEKGLVIIDKESGTVEPVYRFGISQTAGTVDLSGKTKKTPMIREINTLRRMGTIARQETARAVDFYSAGNALCEGTGIWEPWKQAPIINLTAFLSRARALVKQVKSPAGSAAQKQELAQMAVHYCKKSIEAGIEVAESHFVCAQALALAYPHSHDKEILQHYEKPISLYPDLTKYDNYAIFLYMRLEDFKIAEQQFIEVDQLAKSRNYKREYIIGLKTLAEFSMYLQVVAQLAVYYCKKRIEDDIDVAESHFICAQAIALADPHSHEKEIQYHYETSITLRPRVDKYVRYAIFIYKKLKKFEEAERVFFKAKNPQQQEKNRDENVILLNSMAEFYLHWPDHEKKAATILNKLIGRKEKRLEDLSLAARLFEKLELKFSSAFFFEALLKIKPKDIRTMNSYANACVQWGMKDKAIELFEESLSIDAKHVPTLNSYANACVLWGIKKKAIELFEKSLYLQKDNIKGLNSYANACVLWRKKDKAIELFEKNLLFSPNNIQAFHSHANACVQWGMKDKAIELFEKALDIQKDNIQVLNSYANACVQWGMKDKAIELFEKSFSIDDEHVPTLNSYANACVQWGMKDKAIELFEKALSIDSNDALLLTSYGSARIKWGDRQKGQQMLKKAKSLPGYEPPPTAKEPPKETKTPPSEPVPGEIKEEPPKETRPQQPEPAVKAAVLPGPKTGISFTFEKEEKAWLTTFNGEKLTWTGSREWAGFGMLYTLYYLKGELSSVSDLGYIPSLQGEYHRLFTTIDDLYLVAGKAAGKTPVPAQRQWQWQDEWFHQEKSSPDLVAYYDNRMLSHIQNPVCAAFFCQALEASSWHNIAAEFKQEALQWINTGKDQWEPFMTGRSIDLFSPRGKEAFLAFLEEQKKKQEEATGTGPITEKAIDGFLGRFSVTWERMTGYFQELCWRQLTPEEENIALTKLLFLIEKLKTILKNIMEPANSAPDDLKVFLEEISVPTAFMRRLAHYIAEKEKPEPIPLYVTGEILEIKAGTLRVIIEISGEADRELEIPTAEFPAENPQVGQRFFAKIDEDYPGTVYDIEPMKMREKRTFDEIFIDLFGKDIYDKVVSPGQGEEKSS